MLTLFISFRPACVVVSDLQIYSSAQGKVLLALVSAFPPSPLALLLEKREMIKKGEDFYPPNWEEEYSCRSLFKDTKQWLGLEFELPDLLLDIAVSLKAKKKKRTCITASLRKNRPVLIPPSVPV